jgi:hypothetical protein
VAVTQLGLLNAEGSAPAERGRIHVHFGDWREAEPSWPRPFVIVSDVPYGIGYSHGWNRDGRVIANEIKNDRDTTERDAAMAVLGWSAAAIFGPRRFDRVPPWGDPEEILVWDKQHTRGMGKLAIPWWGSWESIAIYGAWSGTRSQGVLRDGGPVTVLRPDSGTEGDKRVHPHQKPVGLLAAIIAKAPPGLPIVDPFLGSGTTAIACALLGREFYGAEIDPQYWPVIRGRLAAVGVVLP